MSTVVSLAAWRDTHARNQNRTTATIEVSGVVSLKTPTFERWLKPSNALLLCEALQWARVMPYDKTVAGIRINSNGQTVHLTTHDVSVALNNGECAQLCSELASSARAIERKADVK